MVGSRNSLSGGRMHVILHFCGVSKAAIWAGFLPPKCPFAAPEPPNCPWAAPLMNERRRSIQTRIACEERHHHPTFGEKKRRTKVIPHFFTEKAAIKLVFATMLAKRHQSWRRGRRRTARIVAHFKSVIIRLSALPFASTR